MMSIGSRGTRALALFLTATSVRVPSASFLKVCRVSDVNTGSSISATLACANSMNGNVVVPWIVALYLKSAITLRAMYDFPELGTPSRNSRFSFGRDLFSYYAMHIYTAMYILLCIYMQAFQKFIVVAFICFLVGWRQHCLRAVECRLFFQ